MKTFIARHAGQTFTRDSNAPLAACVVVTVDSRVIGTFWHRSAAQAKAAATRWPSTAAPTAVATVVKTASFGVNSPIAAAAKADAR